MFRVLSIGVNELDWDTIKLELPNQGSELSLQFFESLSSFNSEFSDFAVDLILYDHSQKIENLDPILKRFLNVPVVFFSKAIKENIEAMKHGAQDFVTPSEFASNEELLAILVIKYMREKRLREENELKHNQKLETLHSSMRALEQHNKEISTINQLSILMQRSTKLTKIFEVIEKFAEKLFPNCVGMIHLYKSPGQPSSMVQWGEWPFNLLVVVESVFATTVESEKRGYSQNKTICNLLQKQLNDAKLNIETLCLPMNVQNESIGFFSLFFLDGQVVPEGSRSLARGFVERVTLTVSNIQLREELRYQSTRDPLTGLYNRRYMEQVFENELRRAIRRNYALSLIMMDIDYFKPINDTLGHEVGDIVLKAVAKFLKKHMRQEDVICRIGGDEFVILLPQTKAKDAFHRANFLRISCNEIPKDPLIVEYDIGTLALSFGVSSYPMHGDDPSELLRAADYALYYSKNHGRNQVCLARKNDTGSLYKRTTQSLDARRWGVEKVEEEKKKIIPILIGSNNRWKLKEIETILKEFAFFDQLEFHLPVDLGITLDVDETGSTYTENAVLKVEAFFKAAKEKLNDYIVLADDSGLEVDVLNGQPGILSARYAPFPDATDADHRRFLLQELKDKEQPWEAKFHCAIAMITPDGLLHLFEGNCPGQILPHERGENGFGYDPIFLLPDRDQTMAELTNEEKNNISHRGQAMHDAITVIQAVLNE